jgi:hypothetical protein
LRGARASESSGIPERGIWRRSTACNLLKVRAGREIVVVIVVMDVVWPRQLLWVRRRRANFDIRCWLRLQRQATHAAKVTRWTVPVATGRTERSGSCIQNIAAGIAYRFSGGADHRLPCS